MIDYLSHYLSYYPCNSAAQSQQSYLNAFRLGGPLKAQECGPESGGGGRVPCVDFKRFDTALTEERFRDKRQLEILTRGFVDKVMEYACAALNARCNFTLYMGVDNDGIVKGIRVQSYELVS